MGYYINPPNQSKEQFLREFGTPIDPKDVLWWDVNEGSLPVCLVDNGAFTAAGIAYSKREAKEFLHSDGRPRKWYSVSKELLTPYLGRLKL